MKKRMYNRIESALEIIAHREGITIEEVRKEIEIALRMGKANPDPMVQEKWRTIPEFPIEETIAHISSKVITDKKE